MPVRQYANAPATTLANSCTALATSLVVTSVTGLPITFPYTLIIDRGTATEEAVSVTAAAGTTLTVTRGIDGTTAFAHSQSATVVHGITAQDIREANTHVNANSGVHGATGSVVGTTDTQTLTNKTVNADSNTLNGFAANSFVVTDGTGKADGSAAQKAIPSGVVVGTTDSQTLTNKTLTSPALTAPTASGSLAGFGGAYTSYTPTLTGSGSNPTLGTGGTANGYFFQLGKTVEYRIEILIGTSPSPGSGSYLFLLPVAARTSANQDTFMGTGAVIDSGTFQTLGLARLNSSTTVTLSTQSPLGVVGSSLYNVASGRLYTIRGTYEAA